MLAMADRHGRVWGSVPGLANRARVELEQCRDALKRFQEPDPDSRTKENEGKRIEDIDGGWRLINYEKYRTIRDEESRREYMADLMKKRRADVKDVSNVSSGYHNAEAEAEAEAEADKYIQKGRAGRVGEKSRFNPPRIETCKAEAVRLGMTDTDGEDFWHHYEGQGWVRSNGQKITNWQSVLKTWKRSRETRKQQERPRLRPPPSEVSP